MAELDTVSIRNPLAEDFTVRFNGEPYKIAAGESKYFPQFLAFHIAKHLSDAILRDEITKLRKVKDTNPYRPQVGQLVVYDNPKRRIALFDVLGSKELVQQCIESYPFKAFIGDMNEYDKYVEKAIKKSDGKKDAEE